MSDNPNSHTNIKDIIICDLMNTIQQKNIEISNLIMEINLLKANNQKFNDLFTMRQRQLLTLNGNLPK